MALWSHSSSPAGGWDGIMCEGRKAGALPRLENNDIVNLSQLASDLKNEGLMDDETPSLTWVPPMVAILRWKYEHVVLHR